MEAEISWKQFLFCFTTSAVACSVVKVAHITRTWLRGNAERKCRKKENQPFKDFPNYFQVEGTFNVLSEPQSFSMQFGSFSFFSAAIAGHLGIVITPPFKEKVSSCFFADLSVIDIKWKIC